MTPTNIQLATHYKINKDTVQKWKKTRPEVYEALVNEYCRTNIVINNKVRYAKFIEDGRSIVSGMLKDSISHVVKQKLESHKALDKSYPEKPPLKIDTLSNFTNGTIIIEPEQYAKENSLLIIKLIYKDSFPYLDIFKKIVVRGEKMLDDDELFVYSSDAIENEYIKITLIKKS